MPPIYITEQNTKIRIRNNCIHVERETGQDPEIAAAVLEIAAIEKGSYISYFFLHSPQK